MKKPLINKRFTLLELLIAVVILVIVSAVVVSIFQETLRSYKKGIAYSDISDNLSGCFMVMESDLSDLLPIEDKKNVFFKKEAFSFIALKETDKKKSFLQLIRYSYNEDEKKLYRAIVMYPADKQNLDGKDIAFCAGLESLNFNYSYTASDKQKKKSKDKDDDSEMQDSSGLFDNDSNNESESGSASTSSVLGKSENSKSSKKYPSVISIAGRIKNEDVEQNFSTALFVKSMEAVKSTGTSTDSGKKDTSDSKDNQTNDKSTGNW